MYFQYSNIKYFKSLKVDKSGQYCYNEVTYKITLVLMVLMQNSSEVVTLCSIY